MSWLSSLRIWYLRNVARKRSSVQAFARWGLWLIQALRESNDSLRSSAKVVTGDPKTFCSRESENPPGQACLTWALSKLFCSSLAETFIAPSVEIPDKQMFHQFTSPAPSTTSSFTGQNPFSEMSRLSIREVIWTVPSETLFVNRMTAILYIQPGLPLVYSVYLKFIIVRLRIWEIVSTTGFHMAKFNEQRQNPERQNPAVAPKCLFVFFHLFYGWVGGKVLLILVRDQQSLLGTSGSPKTYPHWQSRRS